MNMRVLAALSILLHVAAIFACSVPQVTANQRPEVSPDPDAYIPRFSRTRFDNLLRAIQEIPGVASRDFASGEFLKNGAMDWRRGIDRIAPVIDGFGRKSKNRFSTPVVEIESFSGISHFIQLAAQHDRSGRSLVAGYSKLKKDASHPVYFVENRWLRWLIDSETTGLWIAGDTIGPISCGVVLKDGTPCPVHVSRQEFLRLTGGSVKFQVTLDRKRDQPDTIWHEHELHGQTWVGCPTAPIENPEIIMCPQHR